VTFFTSAGRDTTRHRRHRRGSLGKFALPRGGAFAAAFNCVVVYVSTFIPLPFVPRAVPAFSRNATFLTVALTLLPPHSLPHTPPPYSDARTSLAFGRLPRLGCCATRVALGQFSRFERSVALLLTFPGSAFLRWPHSHLIHLAVPFRHCYCIWYVSRCRSPAFRCARTLTPLPMATFAGHRFIPSPPFIFVWLNRQFTVSCSMCCFVFVSLPYLFRLVCDNILYGGHLRYATDVVSFSYAHLLLFRSSSYVQQLLISFVSLHAFGGRLFVFVLCCYTRWLLPCLRFNAFSRFLPSYLPVFSRLYPVTNVVLPVIPTCFMPLPDRAATVNAYRCRLRSARLFPDLRFNLIPHLWAPDALYFLFTCFVERQRTPLFAFLACRFRRPLFYTSILPFLPCRHLFLFLPYTVLLLRTFSLRGSSLASPATPSPPSLDLPLERFCTSLAHGTPSTCHCLVCVPRLN